MIPTQVLDIDECLGIFGLDFFVVLSRAGKRVGDRKHARGRIGAKQRITQHDAIEWFKQRFEGNVY
jgi:large subunit ribosomal protein L11e